jgi:hypothetical protein
MAASFNDMANLANDSTFQGRIGAALIQTCVSISTEGGNNAHAQRKTYVQQVLNNPTVFKPYFYLPVAVDTSVIADATVGGTIAVTPSTAAAQAALVTDTHIAAAISAAFNAFVSGI